MQWEVLSAPIKCPVKKLGTYFFSIIITPGGHFCGGCNIQRIGLYGSCFIVIAEYTTPFKLIEHWFRLCESFPVRWDSSSTMGRVCGRYTVWLLFFALLISRQFRGHLTSSILNIKNVWGENKTESLQSHRIESEKNCVVLINSQSFSHVRPGRRSIITPPSSESSDRMD